MDVTVDSNPRWSVQMHADSDEVSLVIDGATYTLPALEGFKVAVALKAATEVIMGRGERPTMAELIEQSSPGSPEAKAIRSRAPEKVTAEIMRRIFVKGDND